MVAIETSRFPFKKRSHWFAEAQEVLGCDAAFFYACPKPAALSSFSCKAAPTFLIDLTLEESNLRSKLGKNCRYSCNRAPREGIEVRRNEDHQPFLALYREFVGKKDFEGWAQNFYAIAEHGTLYTWYHDNTLQGGLLVLEDEVNSRWLMSGSRRLTEAGAMSPRIMGYGNRYVLWQAILDAKARGLKRFDLGGYYDGDDQNDPRLPITAFKKEFGGESVTLYNCEKYYAPSYRLLKRLRRWIGSLR